MSNGFVHLRAQSHYSFLRAVPAPKDLARAAAVNGMTAIALTDHSMLTGAVTFYKACLKEEIKPIIGLTLPILILDEVRELTVLATSLLGWQQLCQLSSQLCSDPETIALGALPLPDFAKLASDLICLFAIDPQLPFETCLAPLAQQVPSALYVELHPNQSALEKDHIATQARALQLPLVATHPIAYISPVDADVQHTLAAMRHNKLRTELDPKHIAPQGSYFHTAAEMHVAFADYPAAIAATVEIADRCNLTLPLGKALFPEFDLPAGKTVDKWLAEEAERGAIRRYGELTRPLRERLQHELRVIAKRGYAPLFLIVQDIVNYAAQANIPISSRGSAASSLVAHCLGITSPDPMRLNLYFERFLNPARKSPPDIDTDLSSSRRDEVLRYVYQRFGADRVAMVSTINRFRRRSAIREVGKAYGLTDDTIKELTAHLPRWRGPKPNTPNSIDPWEALAQNSPDATVKAALKTALRILRFPRHHSIHAGGLVIAPAAMPTIAPTLLANKGLVITQFDHWTAEEIGLVKLDLLGIRGLSVLGDVAGRIQSWRKTEFKSTLSVLNAIPEDDVATKERLKLGKTIGCFQIESPGMRNVLKEVQAQSIDDLMVALALFRPGPLTGGLKDAFVRRHLGYERVHHLHPALSGLLADTYGVILYQEQVLRIAHEMAGLSLADADLLRRAMSHFDPGSQMITLKNRFISGAQERSNVPPETSERIWDLMAAFAGYGFPKAHAASYAQVAWQAAWSKTHYPELFMAAVLANHGGYYSQRVYLAEVRQMGLKARPPHVNYSQYQFSVCYPDGDPVLYMGLGQVRDLTRATIKRILQLRPFHSFEDFLARVDPRPKEVKHLVMCGACEGLGQRPALLQRLKEGGWRGGQLSLFQSLADSEDWTLADCVKAEERLLGTGVSAHPLALISVPSNVISTEAALNYMGSPVAIAGVQQTRQRFAHGDDPATYVIELEDAVGVLPVQLETTTYRQYKRLLNGKGPFYIEGEMILAPDIGEQRLLAKRITRL